jgi:hypothetical protein
MVPPQNEWFSQQSNHMFYSSAHNIYQLVNKEQRKKEKQQCNERKQNKYIK